MTTISGFHARGLVSSAESERVDEETFLVLDLAAFSRARPWRRRRRRPRARELRKKSRPRAKEWRKEGTALGQPSQPIPTLIQRRNPSSLSLNRFFTK